MVQLKILNFFMTGRRNRAQTATKFGKRCLPNWFFPLRPRRSFPQGISHRESRYLAQKRGKFFLPWLYYGSKNGIERIFGLSKQPQNSVRTSLVPLSICLREVRACGDAGVLGRHKHCGVAPTPTGLREQSAKAWSPLNNKNRGRQSSRGQL